MSIRDEQDSEQRRKEAQQAIRQTFEKWQEEQHGRLYISRVEIQKISGGISVGTLANRDSNRTGIPGAFKFRGKTMYPLSAAVAWLVESVEV